MLIFSCFGRWVPVCLPRELEIFILTFDKPTCVSWSSYLHRVQSTKALRNIFLRSWVLVFAWKCGTILFHYECKNGRWIITNLTCSFELELCSINRQANQNRWLEGPSQKLEHPPSRQCYTTIPSSTEPPYCNFSNRNLITSSRIERQWKASKTQRPHKLYLLENHAIGR